MVWFIKWYYRRLLWRRTKYFFLKDVQFENYIKLPRSDKFSSSRKSEKDTKNF